MPNSASLKVLHAAAPMPSEHRAKLRSSRANARSSTGPRRAEGRARSARNAFRHGLAVPVLADPVLSKEVAALARQISGADAGEEVQELARRVAEAQIDVRRVRALRHTLISRGLRDPDYDSGSNRNKKATIALRIIGRCSRRENIPEEGSEVFGHNT